MKRPSERSFREWRRRRAYDFVPLFARLSGGLIRLLSLTLRKTVEGDHTLQRLLGEGRPFVLAFFHGRQFLLVSHHSGVKFAIMTGLNYLGEIQSRVLAGFGYLPVRGSSSRGGARVLGQMVRLARGGLPAVFAVDGPRGPHRVVKPGVVYLAKKVGAPIVPLSSSSRPAFVLKSGWDRYILPLPFARGHVAYGEPLVLDGDMSEEAIERDCRRLRQALEALDRRADLAAGRRPLDD